MVALLLAQRLQQHLPRGLRGNAAHVGRRDLHLDFVAGFRLSIDCLRVREADLGFRILYVRHNQFRHVYLRFTGLRIEIRNGVRHRVAADFSVCGEDRSFQRVNDVFLI